MYHEYLFFFFFSFLGAGDHIQGLTYILCHWAICPSLWISSGVSFIYRLKIIFSKMFWYGIIWKWNKCFFIFFVISFSVFIFFGIIKMVKIFVQFIVGESYKSKMQVTTKAGDNVFLNRLNSLVYFWSS